LIPESKTDNTIGHVMAMLMQLAPDQHFRMISEGSCDWRLE